METSSPVKNRHPRFFPCPIFCWNQPKYKEGKDAAVRKPVKPAQPHGRGSDSKYYEPRRAEGAVFSEVTRYVRYDRRVIFC